MTVRVIIAGGGTGGHVFPGLAVAEELHARGSEVVFVGTQRGIESRVVPREGYPLSLIDVAGLKGKGLVGLLKGALRLPGAAIETLQLLRRLRPHAVVGVGGYASGPVVALAALLRIPTVVLEQNSVPGVTNRILGRLARKVVIAFPAAASFFRPGRTELLGNPIRRSLRRRLAEPRRQHDDRVCVLVLGGSQGAHAVNELMIRTAALLKARSAGPLPCIRHQTGAADEAEVRARYLELGLSADEARVEPFIEDMAQAYAECDLVVGRAGATTIAEITAFGLPAILIPFPFAADDHQTKNARWLESQGAARVMVQDKDGPEELCRLLEVLSTDSLARRRMAEASRQLGRPDASAEVARGILELVNQEGSQS